MNPLAAETPFSTVRPATGARREPVGAEREAIDRGFVSWSAPWSGETPAFSAADPDTLARAVRAHKAGDAFAQAALTIALMLAIGAVAFVLSSGRAAAAGLLAQDVAGHAATLGALALAGGALLVAARMTLSRVRVRVRDRRRG